MVTMNELVENKQKKTYHTVYETTNSVNGKIYIGVHTTTKINDEYLGSGIYLWKAIDKHGEDKFSKKILAILETRQDAFDLEKKLVNREFVAREDTYNLIIGGVTAGSGVDHPMYGKTHSDTTREKIRQSQLGKVMSKETRAKLSKVHTGKVCSQEHRANMSKARLGHVPTKETREKMSKALTGKVRSAESREKMSNSQQGVTYFNNGKENRRLRLGDKIPEGFVEGMLKIECKFCGEKATKMVIGNWHGKGKCIK